MSSDAVRMVSGDSPRTWRCPKCADDLSATIARESPCPSCGRSLWEIEWPRRLRRIALIAFGIALQLLSGLMFFIIPPGGSIGAWLLYLGVGLAGFLQMFIGLELVRRDRVETSPAVREAEANEAVDLPLHAMRCPRCEHCLIDTIRRNLRRCPDCESHFTLRDLGASGDDPAGEPVTLAPHEYRLGGTLIVAAFVTGMVLVAVVLTTLLAAGSGP